VSADDGNGGTTNQTISVTVTPVNDNSPVFTSPNTASVPENSTVVVNLTATDADLPGQTVTFSITGGADAARFQIVGNELRFVAAPDYEAPTDADANNIYQVQVTANDGNGGTTNQTISVTITPVNDNSPVITSSATPSVVENTTSVVNLTATDADLPGQTVTFSIPGGADAARFQIVGNDLRFVAAPDYETPTDADANNVYQVQVTADDGNGGIANQTISVTVTPVNDNDPVITSSATPSVAENTTSVVTLTATDADLPGQTVSFSITGGVDAARFQIVGGQLQFVSAPDYEAPTDADANNIYQVQVTADDGNGGTTNQTISVTVTPVNDNSPVFTSPNTASVPENSTAVVNLTATDADLPGQTVTFSITGGVDAARFQIVGNELRFVAAPDYEAPTDADANNVYLVQVTADDGNGGTTNQTINVTVTPVNDNNPVITSANAVNVAENTTAVLTVTATDADLPADYDLLHHWRGGSG